MPAAVRNASNRNALAAQLAEQAVLIARLQKEHEALRTERDALRAGKRTDREEIERLTLLIEKLRRMLFGRRSERLTQQIEQLELELEELHINAGVREQQACVDAQPQKAPRLAPTREPLPAHLPREVHEHLPGEANCPACGHAWRVIGEDVAEVLEYVPASLRVVRHVRPRLACTHCDQMAQAPAPSRPVARSYAGPGLLAHITTAKYLDHLPLYRQAQIYAREGVMLAESTMGDWVGAVHALLRPLVEALRRHVFAAEKLHTDDTPIAVLAPGTGKTRTARLWVYVRDDRAAASTTSAAMWLRYSPDRRGIHPQAHLADYRGILQADAYAGYNALYASGRVLEAGCWAHARRKFYDIHAQRATDLTRHVLEQIGALYRIEAEIRGRPPDERLAVRQARSVPIAAALHQWLQEQLQTVSRKSVVADAIGYAMNQWQALTRFLEDGRIEIDNSAAERALRSVAVGRKNYLFLGSDAGGDRAATLYSLLGTARLCGINPEAYLRHVLTVIAEHPVNRVDELLPWNVKI